MKNNYKEETDFTLIELIRIESLIKEDLEREIKNLKMWLKEDEENRDIRTNKVINITKNNISSYDEIIKKIRQKIDKIVNEA